MLSTPPAFVLSQDQTLQLYILTNHSKLKLKKSRIGLLQCCRRDFRPTSLYRPTLLLFSFQRSIQRSVSVAPRSNVAAVTAIVTHFVFKVKLYFLAANFLFSNTLTSRCVPQFALLLLAAVSRHFNMLPFKCQAENQLCDFFFIFNHLNFEMFFTVHVAAVYCGSLS